jgi:hypothetical protein
VLALTCAACTAAGAAVIVVVLMAVFVKMVVRMGMIVGMVVFVTMGMGVGNAIVGMLVGVFMGMAVAMIAAANMIVMDMHSSHSFSFFLIIPKPDGSVNEKGGAKPLPKMLIAPARYHKIAPFRSCFL